MIFNRVLDPIKDDNLILMLDIGPHDVSKRIWCCTGMVFEEWFVRPNA